MDSFDRMSIDTSSGHSLKPGMPFVFNIAVDRIDMSVGFT
jgi:hypothetical protein